MVAEPAVQPRQLGPRLDPELRVQVGQRLIEQEDLRLPHDRPAERDPLPLAARELCRLAVEHGLQPEDPGRGVHPAGDRSAGGPRIRRPNARFSRTVMCG